MLVFLVKYKKEINVATCVCKTLKQARKQVAKLIKYAHSATASDFIIEQQTVVEDDASN